MSLPTGQQLFWGVVISLATMALVKHVAPRVPVVGEFVQKLAA